MLNFLFSILFQTLATLLGGAVAASLVGWFVTPVFGGPHITFRECVGFLFVFDVLLVPVYVAIGSQSTQVSGVMRAVASMLSYVVLLVVAAFFHFALGI
jgi:hypothetical protein